MARVKTDIPNILFDEERKRFVVCMNFGKDKDGKRIRKHQSFKTKADAKKALKEFEADKIRGELTNPNEMTVGQLLDSWMNALEVAKKAETTLMGYENIVRQIKVELGDVKVVSLTTSQVRTYYLKKMEGNEEKGIKPMSGNTIRHHNTLLKSALNFAMKENIVRHNIIKGLNVPEYVKPSIDFYNITQLNTLLQCCDGTDIEGAVWLVAFLGLRREEVAVLQWEDIDFEKKEVYIHRALTKMNNKLIEKETKSKASVRKIALCDKLLDKLKELKQKQDMNKSDFPLSYQENDYINVDTLGNLIEPDQLSQKLRDLVKREKLCNIHFRGLRHSVASIANEQGKTLFDISRLLGHSTISTTGNIYTQLFIENNKVAADSVANAIISIN